MTNIRKVHVTDATTGATQGVDSLGHADVIRHAHEEGGMINFASGDISASQDFQLIDLSDTTNYPHTNTSWAHIAWINVDIDSDNSGDYTIEFGFLDSVDGTNGDFYPFGKISGSKTAGNSKTGFWAMLPEGPKCRVESVAASNVSLNDVAFQTDVNLATTLSPGATASPSGNGDIVMRVVRNAGTIVINVQLYYHTHA